MTRALSRLLTAAACVVAFPAAPAGATSPSIARDDALTDVRFLSAPDLQGRGTLTDGLNRAADYVAGRFRAAGLAPAGEGGTFFQDVDVPVAHQIGPRLSLAVAGTRLKLGEEYVPNKSSPATRAVGGAVFAGYGIVVPDRYDDYAGIDARGKLVVLLRYGPHYDPKTGKPADKAFEEAASIGRKTQAAIEHGAIGIAIVDLVNQGEKPAPLTSLSARGGGGSTAIASFHLHPSVVDRLWLAALGRDLASVRKTIDDSNRPLSFDLPGEVDFNVEWIKSTRRTRNVVALLEGSDPVLRHEAVLVGAHYDHLGLGDEGSALDGPGLVHPGADDNASGTAAVLEIAEAFAAAKVRPRRSLLFAAFTGEERGLLGSEVFAARPGARKLVAMINLDMVGRMTGNALEVGGAPTSPDWEATVSAANADQLKLTFPKRVVPNSDHASFLKRNVPALFLFTGMHADYHRIGDTWEKVNADGLVKVAQLAYRVAAVVADRPALLAFVAPSWTRGGGASGSNHGPTVRLGVMPDYQFDRGLRISTVLPGGAGAAAGLAAGDVIERIGDKNVPDVEGYMDVLATFKPGDETVLHVRRDGALRDLKARFTAAPPPEDKP
jgi:aminopeptidase YwaD